MSVDEAASELPCASVHECVCTLHIHIYTCTMYYQRNMYTQGACIYIVCTCVYMSWILTVHAAVMAINEVLEKEDAQETLKALQNPSACLVDVQAGNAERYQPHLLQAKRDKAEKAGSQVKWGREGGGERGGGRGRGEGRGEGGEGRREWK